MRKLTPRTNALYVLYFGAFLVTSEIAIERFLATLPEALLTAARVLQIVGFLFIVVGLAQVVQANKAQAASGPEEFIDVIQSITKRTHAYIREAFAHALGGVALYLVAALYAGLYWWTNLSTTPRAAYYLVLLVAAFTGLAIAWLVPLAALRREVDRLRELETKEHA